LICISFTLSLLLWWWSSSSLLFIETCNPVLTEKSMVKFWLIRHSRNYYFSCNFMSNFLLLQMSFPISHPKNCWFVTVHFVTIDFVTVDLYKFHIIIIVLMMIIVVGIIYRMTFKTCNLVLTEKSMMKFWLNDIQGIVTFFRVLCLIFCSFKCHSQSIIQKTVDLCKFHINYCYDDDHCRRYYLSNDFRNM
jgi:hypothetical protein